MMATWNNPTISPGSGYSADGVYGNTTGIASVPKTGTAARAINSAVSNSDTAQPTPVFAAVSDRVELSATARQLAQQAYQQPQQDTNEAHNPFTTGTNATSTVQATPQEAQSDLDNPQAQNPAPQATAEASPSVPAEPADDPQVQEQPPIAAEQPGNDNKEDNGGGTPQGATGSTELDAAEVQEVQELKQRDQEVRTHEAAHAAVGGQYAGAPTLEYETGPDGRRYAVSGEVNVDMSKVKGDPQETIDKMEQIQAAALAPAQPSAQDRRVAARAAQIAAQARMDLRQQQSPEPYPSASATPEAESAPEITIESLKWAGSIA